MCKLENGKACVILCLRRYNERKIVMDKKFLRHISSMMLPVCTLAAVSPVTAFAGWQKEGDTYAYYEDDGTRVENAFRKSGNQWFYLDENATLLKNCEREIDGKIYVSMKEVQWFLPLPEKQEAVKVLSLIFLPSAADSSI